MDFKDFKKTSDDGKVATLQHPSGHKIQIVKGQLSKDLKGQLNKLPLHQSDPETPVADPTAGLTDDDAPNATDAATGHAVNINIGVPQSAQPAPAPAQQAPTPQAAATPPMDGSAVSQGAPTPSGAYGQAIQGAQGMSQALQQQGQRDSNIYGGAAQSEQNMQTQFTQHMNELGQEVHNAAQDVKDGYIRPNAYLENQSTGGKIATAIGLILGGAGSGITGGPNPALQFLNSQIERNLEAQKANLGSKESLLTALDSKYKNTIVRDNMFRSINANIVANQIMQSAAKSKSAQAIAQAHTAVAGIENEFLPTFMKAAWLQSATGAQSGQGQASNVDPAVYVPHLVPPAEQAKVFDEIKDAQNVKGLTPKIMKAFDDASQFSVAKTLPGLEGAGQKEFSGLINTTVKEQEGTARQAAFDSIAKNMRPQFGDSDATLAKKRQTTLDYLASKASAPTAKGYGIDLAKFPSTAAPSTVKTMNGVKYKQVAGGWQKVQ